MKEKLNHEVTRNDTKRIFILFRVVSCYFVVYILQARQRKAEARTRADFRFDRDRAAVLFDDFLDQR